MHPLSELFGGAFEEHRIQGGAGHGARSMALHGIFRVAHARDDEAHSPLGPLHIEVDAGLGKGPLGIRQTRRAHGGHDKAVLQHARPDLGWCE